MPSADNAKPEYPAPHLDVLARGVAAIAVSDAWARPTVPGQTTSAIYAHLSAPSGGRLVSVSSPIADVSMHEMHMEGDLMRMRDVPDGLELPAGKPVELAPNGTHLMLTELKQPLPVGTAVPLVLHFVDLDGRKGDLTVQVPVTAAPVNADEHHHHG